MTIMVGKLGEHDGEMCRNGNTGNVKCEDDG